MVNLLINKMHRHVLDLQAKDESIQWLRKVLATAKNKAEYYRLTSEKDHASMLALQNDVQSLKNDFAQRIQDLNQFDTVITACVSKRRVSL